MGLRQSEGVLLLGQVLHVPVGLPVVEGDRSQVVERHVKVVLHICCQTYIHALSHISTMEPRFRVSVVQAHTLLLHMCCFYCM